MSDIDGLRSGISAELSERLTCELRDLLIDRPDLLTNDLQLTTVADAARDLVDRKATLLPEAERAMLVQRLISDTLGLGPIEDLLTDPDIDEIMVNGPDLVFVERNGRIEQTTARFDSATELRHVIERILARVGRRVDEANPLADARLPDGSRVNCVIPPLSLSGELLTIRKFRRHGYNADELIKIGTLSSSLGELLAACVKGRANMIVSGGTGSGKTTTLNALSGSIPPTERVITIEDAAELRLQQPHVLRLESRPTNLEGRGEITIRALVRNALRMRPDRIIVGEVRGGEALDMLQAMNTGHEGSLTTLHANSPADAVRRVETLALMADVDLPHRAIQRQVAGAIDVIVHQRRDYDGRRVVSEVAQVQSGTQLAEVRTLYSLNGRRPVWKCEPNGALAEKVRAGGGWQLPHVK